jgi:tetratricopeptide (TPR) repeat protein
MAEVKHAEPRTENTVVVDRAKDFWSQYNKPILIGGGALILLLGGYIGYKKIIQEPKEGKAADAVFKSHDYYMQDSTRLSLNGDARYPGAAKVADQYGSTKAGNLAKFIAGSNYLKMEDYKNAEKYLKDFETDSKITQARAYKLLADAYAGQGKNEDALKYYTKAGRHFEDDRNNSPEYLYLAAYFAHKVMRNNGEAIELYKEIKKKYSNSGPSTEADKHLAELGVYTAE